jgi:signal transduction histidine kinase
LGEIFSQMADRIAAQIQALRTEDRLRREFTATITHDLRTPLTSLQGYLETLLMKEAELTPDERRGYLITAVRRSEQLGKLVASLFDLARLDAPGFEPRFEPFSLAELVQDILQKFRLAAEKKKVGLRMDVPEELPRAQADIGLVERVFENLIGNALRYTPENGTISVSAAPEEERISVMVSDTGPGIPPEDLAGLFDRHRRRAKADHHAGAGLGLAIAKRIIELHGGGIKVRSEARTGTAFTFSLPRSRESRSFAPPVP